MPAVSVEEFPENERMHAAEIFSSVRGAQAKEIEARVQVRYDMCLETVPAIVRAQMGDSVRVAWSKEHYLNIVVEVLGDCAEKEKFIPEVHPSELPEAQQQRAADILSRVTSVLGEAIACETTDKFHAFWSTVPTTLGLHVRTARPAWMLEHYYELAALIVEGKPVVGSSAEEVTTPMFHPLVPLASLALEAQAAAKAVLSRITPGLASSLPAELEERCEAAYMSVPSALALPREQFRAAWLDEKYYAELAVLVDRGGSPARGSPARRRVEPTSPLIRSVRARVAATPPETSALEEAETRSIFQWHTDTVRGGDSKAIVGIIYRHEAEPRLAKVQDRKTKSLVEKPVYRVWLSDGTAVIETSFWAPLAEQVHRETIEHASAFESGTMLVMNLRKFSVRGDDRRHLCAHKRLTASDGASVAVWEASPEEKRQFSKVAMTRELYITQYDKLRQMGPFCCNVIGIVSAPGGVYTSAAGVEMLSFDLVSAQNEKIGCVAFGTNADPDMLIEGREVAIQLAQSKKGRYGESSRLWLYDDSVVAGLAEECSLPSSAAKEILLEFPA